MNELYNAIAKVGHPRYYTVKEYNNEYYFDITRADERIRLKVGQGKVKNIIDMLSLLMYQNVTGED